MTLATQLLLGNVGNIAEFVFGICLLVISVPMLIWLIFSIIRWSKHKNGKPLRWWAITSTTLCGLGIVIYLFVKVFSGAPYSIASKVHIHVPMPVHVLENDSTVAIDGSESYTVVQLNDTQMHTFVNAAKGKGWTFASVEPYSLLRVPAGDYLMSDKAHPLPKTRRDGYYYASVQSSNKKYAGVGGYVIRKVYFADVGSKTLYVYSYQGQGP